MEEKSAEWQAFDPGFDHGTPISRPPNVPGSLFGKEQMDYLGADVRDHNIEGTLGAQAADVTEGVLVPTLSDKASVGDPEFAKVLREIQSPLSFTALSWRLGVFGLALLPLASMSTLVGLVIGDSAIWLRVVAAIGLPICLVPALFSARMVRMVKSGSICFVQLAEDGTTQLLMPGVHVALGIATSTQSFMVTEDQMEFGTMSLIRVRPGMLGLATDNGKPQVMLPGVHLINSPNFKFGWMQAITDNIITNGALNIIRVNPGCVGLAIDNGHPVMLLNGVHCINSASFVFNSEQSLRDNIIRNQTLFIIRVGPGLVGRATVNGKPLLLEQGVHFIHDAAFDISTDESSSLMPVGKAWGPWNSLSVVVVPRGQICPILQNGEGHFLLEGRHVIEHGRFSFGNMQDLTSEYVTAGTRHRVVVPRGKLGLALEAGHPVLLEPGSIHLKNSALFQYMGSVDITQAVIEHGSLKIVIVKDGQVGVTYHDGVIELLSHGRHMLESATHTLGGFVNTGQETFRIDEVVGMSADNVELSFDAAICIKVVDAQKAVTNLASSNPDKSVGKNADIMTNLAANLRERAKLALSIIIGNNTLNRKHSATSKSKNVSGTGDGEDDFEEVKEDQEETSDSGGGFRGAIHDTFMLDFSKHMEEDCGVHIVDMSVEDIRIVNTELKTAMASAAVANSSLEKNRIDAEIAQVKAQAQSKVAVIEAEGRATSMAVTAKAEANRIKVVSDALAAACSQAQQQEIIRTSADAINRGSTVMLAQDVGSLATLLSGAQGSKITSAL